MVKKLCLIIVGLIAYFTASSQNFKIGFATGFVVANSIYQPYNKADSKEGYYHMASYNINGLIEYKKAKRWGISIQPGFIQKGSLFKPIDIYIRLNLNYLQMPVLIEYYLYRKFYISSGLEFGYLINAKSKRNNESNNITNYYSNRFEISGLIGINYLINDKFVVGLRYSRGFTRQANLLPISFNWYSGLSSGGRVYNQYFQLFLGVKIF